MFTVVSSPEIAARIKKTQFAFDDNRRRRIFTKPFDDQRVRVHGGLLEQRPEPLRGRQLHRTGRLSQQARGHTPQVSHINPESQLPTLLIASLFIDFLISLQTQHIDGAEHRPGDLGHPAALFRCSCCKS